MNIAERINNIIMVVFLVCYLYQFLYIPIALMPKKRVGEGKRNRIAVLIAARNEEAVIGALLDSIRAQDYPAELVDVYVTADNCTDSTAEIAASGGATVFERFDSEHIGKGYVLNYMLGRIDRDRYDGFLVLDADNVLNTDYITEINRVFSQGYGIVTSRRNSKNYGDNWISAGYALWFLRESRYLNGARARIGSSCAVSGTGFIFSREVLEKCGGWRFFFLTEDIEFTIHNIIRGEKIGYADGAVLYDEQPVSFGQSFRQRLRWSRGYLQVFSKYGGALMRGIIGGSMSCFDMTMSIMPAATLSAAGIICNAASVLARQNVASSLLSIISGLYTTMFVIGAVTTATEWKSIHCSGLKKALYTFTFPLFMVTYIPISIISIFVNPGWKPIRHTRSLTADEICRSGKRGQLTGLRTSPRL